MIGSFSKRIFKTRRLHGLEVWFSAFAMFEWRRQLRIYYVNTTTARVTSGSKMARSGKCEGFIRNISGLMSND